MQRHPQENRKKPRYIYSIISMVLVLFTLGFFGMAILQAQQLIKYYKEQIDILVEIKSDTPKSSILEVKNQIKKHAFVKNNSIQYISKEEGIKMLELNIGEDFKSMDFQNPLFDMLIFNVNAEQIQEDSLERVKNTVKQLTQVRDVYYQEGLIGNVEKNIQKLGIGMLLVGVLFIVITITLIHNTIRLALYANRFVIKNMELVGASWRFISWPYMKKSFINGLISGVVAVGLLVILLIIAQRDFPELQNLSNFSSFGLLFSALIILGVLISLLSTYFVVNKYLRMRVDDMY